MTYNRNDVFISVEQIDGFGKNLGLWIGTRDPNQMVKVASFGSEDKAEQFCKWFEYISGASGRQPTMGRWIEYPEAYSKDVVICSACDHVFNIFNNCVEEFNCCPHCGAWMER